MSGSAVTATGPPMPRGLVPLLAVAGGACVANTYYVQPLLATLQRQFGHGEALTGLLVTAGQLGYVAGLVLLVPLGDVVDRRRLVCTLMALSAAALAAAAAAPSLALLGGALAALGITTVAAQVLVPIANDLAAPAERGRVVSRLVSGFLIGILGARAFSGIVADLAGWRIVYATLAGFMAVLACCVGRALPASLPRGSLPYAALIRSLLTVVHEHPVLRLRMCLGLLGMGSFTVLWTALTFLLSGAPFHYSDSEIGLIGLTGVVGAASSQASGRLFDRGLAWPALGALWALGTIAWGVCALGSSKIVPLLIGIVLLDFAVQGQHMLNQSTILDLAPEIRSRANTAYVVAVFAGASSCAAAASVLWAAGGWLAVCALGGGLAGAALSLWGLQVR